MMISNQRADLLVSLAQLEAVAELPSTSSIRHWSHASSIPAQRALGHLLWSLQNGEPRSARAALWSKLELTLKDEGVVVWLEAVVPFGLEVSVPAESPHAPPGSWIYKAILVRAKALPQCEGGAEDPSNMQWQTVSDAKAKDKTEWKH